MCPQVRRIFGNGAPQRPNRIFVAAEIIQGRTVIIVRAGVDIFRFQDTFQNRERFRQAPFLAQLRGQFQQRIAIVTIDLDRPPERSDCRRRRILAAFAPPCHA